MTDLKLLGQEGSFRDWQVLGPNPQFLMENAGPPVHVGRYEFSFKLPSGVSDSPFVAPHLTCSWGYGFYNDRHLQIGLDFKSVSGGIAAEFELTFENVLALRLSPTTSTGFFSVGDAFLRGLS
ncbi:hypothetical protein [Asticcacaulis sp. AND118]|uniref:hypothetical protein n=1 Tax=Asticcacaulis sp. AND118 TaxID=2840468 RepID=UPI001CFFAD84|nr:hypothetical protein [Asticcacaulis sp. AND118]UDF03394.1 hypothetical protein LH365_13280 [Asticcacaulis sp. AND118]